MYKTQDSRVLNHNSTLGHLTIIQALISKTLWKKKQFKRPEDNLTIIIVLARIINRPETWTYTTNCSHQIVRVLPGKPWGHCQDRQWYRMPPVPLAASFLRYFLSLLSLSPRLVLQPQPLPLVWLLPLDVCAPPPGDDVPLPVCVCVGSVCVCVCVWGVGVGYTIDHVWGGYKCIHVRAG